MQTTETLLLPTEDEVRRHVPDDVFRRGEGYHRGGAVLSLARRGPALLAEVAGSEPEPYRVRVSVDDRGRVAAACTCPYAEANDGWCKHVVAALLSALRRPEEVEAQPALDTLLSGFTPEQLRALVSAWADRDPDAYDQLCLVAARTGGEADAGEALEAARRQALRRIRRALHAAGDEDDGEEGRAMDELRKILAEARDLIDRGDAVTALAVLDALTEEVVPRREFLDPHHSGRMRNFLHNVGCAWAQAVLSAPLTVEARRCMEEKLAAWDAELSSADVNAFGSAALAAHEGWDDPRVSAVLAGESAELFDADLYGGDRADFLIDFVTDARLAVLEREGRLEEALRLARAVDNDEAVADLLLRLGRTEEALAHAISRVRSRSAALALAQRLWHEGQQDAALELGESALDAAGEDGAALAAWLRDRAEEAGNLTLALRAAEAAFRAAPALDSWDALQRVAGDGWEDARRAALAHLRSMRDARPESAVDVYLHENLFADALEVVEDGWQAHLALRVADAAAERHPERVIPLCRRHAERMMEGAQPDDYPAAARWLAVAKRAYAALGKEAEWSAYLEAQIERHRKKYRLRPLLEALRDSTSRPALTGANG